MPKKLPRRSPSGALVFPNEQTVDTALTTLTELSQQLIKKNADAALAVARQAVELIQYLIKENAELRAQIAHMNLKQQHGCTDAYCPKCDDH